MPLNTSTPAMTAAATGKFASAQKPDTPAGMYQVAMNPTATAMSCRIGKYAAHPRRFAAAVSALAYVSGKLGLLGMAVERHQGLCDPNGVRSFILISFEKNLEESRLLPLGEV